MGARCSCGSGLQIAGSGTRTNRRRCSSSSPFTLRAGVRKQRDLLQPRANSCGKNLHPRNKTFRRRATFPGSTRLAGASRQMEGPFKIGQIIGRGQGMANRILTGFALLSCRVRQFDLQATPCKREPRRWSNWLGSAATALVLTKSAKRGQSGKERDAMPAHRLLPRVIEPQPRRKRSGVAGPRAGIRTRLTEAVRWLRPMSWSESLSCVGARWRALPCLSAMEAKAAVASHAGRIGFVKAK